MRAASDSRLGASICGPLGHAPAVSGISLSTRKTYVQNSGGTGRIVFSIQQSGRFADRDSADAIVDNCKAGTELC